MRRRFAVVLIAVLAAVPFHAQAAPSIVSAVAVTAQKAIVLNATTKTVVIKAQATAAPVKATLTCIEVTPRAGLLQIGPVHQPLAATEVNLSAVAKNVTYRVTFFSIAPQGDAVVQAVLSLGMATTSFQPNHCGTDRVLSFGQAAGVAIY